MRDNLFLFLIDIPIKPSNIRIWIHDRNIKQLSKVIWSGFGDKLLTETSKQVTVNKFLKAVPHIMVTHFQVPNFYLSIYFIHLYFIFKILKGYY